MNAVSVDIKDMLVAGLSYTFATDIFIGKEPTTPDNCVTIFDTGGGAPQLTFTQGERYEYPTFQIRVRNKSYLVGMAAIEAIKESLHGRAQESWNGTLYSVVYCSSGPALLDWDDSNRCRFIINFNAQRR